MRKKKCESVYSKKAIPLFGYKKFLTRHNIITKKKLNGRSYKLLRVYIYIDMYQIINSCCFPLKFHEMLIWERWEVYRLFKTKL